MIEVFKAALIPEQIRAKKEKLNARNFEIQLLGDSIGESVKLVEDFSKCIPLMDNIVSVHTALTNDEDIIPGGNCDIAYLYDINTMRALQDACLLADMSGLNHRHKVGVVIHNSLSYEQFSENPYILKLVTDTLGSLLDKYPNIEFWIENVTPICTGKTIAFKNGCLSDAADICRHLSKDFGNRVGTVFDTCHATTTARILRDLGCGEILPDMFKAFSGTCKEVHLANVREYGFKNGQHGCGFEAINDKDRCNVYSLLRDCKEYFPGALLCYEIAETDYVINQQTYETMNLVHEILNNR